MLDSVSNDHFENTKFWEPSRYEGADQVRIQTAQQWVPQDVQSILDVGCGNGLFADQLHATHQIVGVDRSSAALSFVQVPCGQADAAALPFAENSFDLVISMEVIEHLPIWLSPTVLREIMRATRKYALITVPYCENLEIRRVSCPSCGCIFHPHYHMRSFSEQDLVSLFDFGDEGNESMLLTKHSGLYPVEKRLFTDEARYIWRAMLGQRMSFPWHAICPQCGYQQKTEAAQDGQNTEHELRHENSGSSHLKRKLSNLRPVVQNFQWWIALYEKR